MLYGLVLVGGEQDLLKNKCAKEKCSLQLGEMHSEAIAPLMVKRNAINITNLLSYNCNNAIL